MRHLFATRAEVWRLSGDLAHGTPTLTWVKVTTNVDPQLGDAAGELLCRLDLTFQRPGKDQPMPAVAGRPPDRIGVMFYTTGCDVRAGDRIRAVAGPIDGTFEIRAIPDPANAYSAAHHMEVQIVEVARALADTFPGGTMETT